MNKPPASVPWAITKSTPPLQARSACFTVPQTLPTRTPPLWNLSIISGRGKPKPEIKALAPDSIIISTMEFFYWNKVN